MRLISRSTNEEFRYARDIYKFIGYIKKAIGTKEASGVGKYSIYEFPGEQLSKRQFEEICTRPTRIISLLFAGSDELKAKITNKYYAGIRYDIETCPTGINRPNRGIERAFRVHRGHAGGFERTYGKREFSINYWSPLNSNHNLFENEDEIFDRLCSERERINRALVEMIINPDEFISGLDTLILYLEQNPPNEKEPLEVSATYKRIVSVDG